MSKETELSDEQIDGCWDGLMPSGNGKSRYDIARAIIAADRELRRGDAKRLTQAEPVTDAEILEVCGDFAKDAIGQTNLIRIGRQLIAFSASRARLFRLGLSHGVNPS